MKFKGGKTVYGACLGILMLEAKFPRIPGDVGNESYHEYILLVLLNLQLLL